MDDIDDEFEEDEELTEFIQDPQDQADIEEISFESESIGFRGRKGIPDRWTGVISLDHDNLQRLNLRHIATDLKMTANLPTGTK